MNSVLCVTFLLVALVANVEGAVTTDWVNLIDQAYLGGNCNASLFNLTSGCTRPLSYWRTHYSGSPDPALDVAWPGTAFSPTQNFCLDVFRSSHENITAPGAYFMSESSYGLLAQSSFTPNIPFFVNGTISPLSAIGSGVSRTSACFVHAQQYVSALNNLCSGACYGYGGVSSAVWAAMKLEASFLFGEHCQNSPADNYNVSDALKLSVALLKKYNTGAQIFTPSGCQLEYGPYLCEVVGDNVTVAPCRPSSEEDLTDTCVGGCTERKGYWKRNALSVPAAFQWNMICDLDWVNSTDGVSCSSISDYLTCDSPLENASYSPYIPALTWAGILSIPARGDACLVAAKELIAAELNIHCIFSCIPTSVAPVIAEIKAIMVAECSDMTSQGLNGLGPVVAGVQNSTSAIRHRRVSRNLLRLSEALQAYNKGDKSGPGLCDEVLNPRAIETSPLVDDSILDKDDLKFIQDMLISILSFVVFVAAVILVWVVYMFCVKYCGCFRDCMGDDIDENVSNSETEPLNANRIGDESSASGKYVPYPDGMRRR